MANDNAVSSGNFFDKLREYAADANFVDEEANRLVQLFDRITGYHQSKATDNPGEDTRHLNPTGTFVPGVNSPIPDAADEEDTTAGSTTVQQGNTIPTAPNAAPVDASGGTVTPQNAPVQADVTEQTNTQEQKATEEAPGNVTFQPASPQPANPAISSVTDEGDK